MTKIHVTRCLLEAEHLIEGDALIMAVGADVGARVRGDPRAPRGPRPAPYRAA
jgi:hypothetical protein